MEATKSTLPSRYNPYFSCLLCIAKGNHQESEGGGGGKALLYSEKSTLKVATSAISPSKSCQIGRAHV